MDESKTRSSVVEAKRANSARSWSMTRQLGAACFLSALGVASAQAQAVPPAAPVAPEPAPAPAPVVAPAPAPAPVAPVVVAPAPVVVVAPVAPPAPAAPTWSPVYTGSFFTRYELRQGFDNAGIQPRPRFVDGDAVFYRARFGIGTGVIELGDGFKVGAQFTPQAAGVFGSLSNTIQDVSLGLHEGYARVARKYVRLDAGRFELNYGDALVLGNLDWNEIGRSFDGVRTRISSSPTSAWVDVFASVLREGRQYPVPLAKAGDGDQYFLGAYAALGPAITPGLDLDVYLFTQIWADTQRTSSTYAREGAAQVTLGARAKQKIKRFDYRFEGGLQAGKRSADLLTIPAMPSPTQVTKLASTDVLAYQMDLELGIAAVPDKLRFSLEGLYASGNDPNSTKKNEGWDELFPTAHKFLGLTDAFVLGGQKRTNVASGVLHVTSMPTKSLTIQLDGHVFARPEKIAGAAPATGMATQQKGFAGSEVDVGLTYQLAKGLKTRALYGVFMPGSDFYPTASTTIPSGKGKDPDPVHFLEIELRYDL